MLSAMNMEIPPGEMRGIAVVIHHNKPEACPQCGSVLDPCEAEHGVSINVAAWRCAEGHRIHAFVKD